MSADLSAGMARYLHATLCLTAAVAFCAWAILQATATRQLTHQLTHQLTQLRQKHRILLDERRNLLVEYAAITDYAQVLAAARQMGMVEPQLESGSLVFLTADNVQ